jgi:UDP-3-O-[3-hydroxymyristoyl] glucosamine N-acyltransferase
MGLTVKEIANLLGVDLPSNFGCFEKTIDRVCSPRKVQTGCVVVASTEKVLKEIKSAPDLLIVKKGAKVEGNFPCLLKVENPRLAMALLLEVLHPQNHPEGVSPKASLGNNVSLGKGVYVGDFAYIGNNVVLEDGVKIYPGCYIGDNTVIGEGSVIYPNVFIGEGTVIGRGVIVFPGAVVGREGFGFAFDGKRHVRLRHVGNVVIEDYAEIGANSCVDRALLEETVVGEGSKIDNLVQVAHNNLLGRGVILVSQVGLAGSVEVGDFSVLAGQVGVADHVRIGKGVTVVAKSGVSRDLPDGGVYGSNLPAVEWTRWKKIYLTLLKLPELAKTVRTLAKKIGL